MSTSASAILSLSSNSINPITDVEIQALENAGTPKIKGELLANSSVEKYIVIGSSKHRALELVERIYTSNLTEHPLLEEAQTELLIRIAAEKITGKSICYVKGTPEEHKGFILTCNGTGFLVLTPEKKLCMRVVNTATERSSISSDHPIEKARESEKCVPKDLNKDKESTQTTGCSCVIS